MKRYEGSVCIGGNLFTNRKLGLGEDMSQGRCFKQLFNINLLNKMKKVSAVLELCDSEGWGQAD